MNNLEIYSNKQLDALNLDPQNISWRTFDPFINFFTQYHNLVADAFNKLPSPEKSYRSLLGRVAIIATAPLGYLAVSISALFGILFFNLLGFNSPQLAA